jgi:prepilin-type N-terminal cleavage/methylation domain-containing protein
MALMVCAEVTARMPTWNSDRHFFARAKGFVAQADGFTLLELMMVLLLIGLMATVALTLDFAGSAASQQQQAALLAQQFRLASIEAVQSGNLWALDFFKLSVEQGRSQTGYRWLFHDGTRWRAADPKWLDAKSSETLLPTAMQLRLSVDGSALEPEPQQQLVNANGAANQRFTPEVLLLPTREFTAFSARVCSADDQQCGAGVSVDALGRVVMQADNEAR